MASGAPDGGRRVMIVEDDYFIANEAARHFTREGASIVGPVATVGAAMTLLQSTERLDAAVLDINLNGEMAFEIADALIDSNVPFVFATGYDTCVIPDRFTSITHCPKPVVYRDIARALGFPPHEAGSGDAGAPPAQTAGGGGLSSAAHRLNPTAPLRSD